jgi:hypothetical protein
MSLAERPPSLDGLVEEHYIEAVRRRDASETVEQVRFWQGAIEVLEDIMHKAHPNHGWAYNAGIKAGLPMGYDTQPPIVAQYFESLDYVWECDKCEYHGEPIDRSGPGFTGATIYVSECPNCGWQDIDSSGDNLEAVR